MARTRQVLAFTYPPDRWYVRTMFAFGNGQEGSGVCSSRARANGSGIGGFRAGPRHATWNARVDARPSSTYITEAMRGRKLLH